MGDDEWKKQEPENLLQFVKIGSDIQAEVVHEIVRKLSFKENHSRRDFILNELGEILDKTQLLSIIKRRGYYPNGQPRLAFRHSIKGDKGESFQIRNDGIYRVRFKRHVEYDLEKKYIRDNVGPGYKPPTDEQKKEWKERRLEWDKTFEEQKQEWILHGKLPIYSLDLEANWIYECERVIKWRFKDLFISEILVHEENDLIEYRYSGYINGHPFIDKSIKELKDWLIESCLLHRSDAAKFGPLLTLYVEHEQIPSRKCSSIMGFTPKGWFMPQTHHIVMNAGIQTNIRKLVEGSLKFLNPETMEEKTYKEIRERWKELYANTTLEHKDILFSWWIAAHFGYALRDTITDLMPILTMGGIPGTGKTSWCRTLTRVTFNNLDKVINKDTASSSPRALSYLSASTFPTTFDDVGDLDPRLLNDINNYTSGKGNFERNKTDNSLQFSKPLISPLIMTFNEFPAYYRDLAFKTRAIHIELRRKPTSKEAETFKEMSKSIPDGYFGNLIFAKTEDWLLDDVIERWSLTEYWPKAPSDRENTKFRFIHFGASLVKEFFDMEMDLSGLEQILIETQQVGNDDIFDLVKDQIRESVNLYRWETKVNDAGRTVKIRFKSSVQWINSPVKVRSDGYLYKTGNRLDLVRRLLWQERDLSMRRLESILQSKWEGVEYKTFRVKNTTERAIFIPLNAFELEADKDFAKKLKRLFIQDRDKYNLILTMKKVYEEFESITSSESVSELDFQTSLLVEVNGNKPKDERVSLEEIREIINKFVEFGLLYRPKPDWIKWLPDISDI